MVQRTVSDEPKDKAIKDRISGRLAEIWAKNRSLIEERLEDLERAGSPDSTEAELLNARDAAHNLAGSLGMFGLHQGTEIARRLELLLELRPPDRALVAQLTEQLHSLLFPAS